MTKHWCPECEGYRGNYVDDDGRLRGIDCNHLLDAPENTNVDVNLLTDV